MIRVFDFTCTNGHAEEVFTRYDSSHTCSVCGQPAQRVLSSPRFKLDGTSGDFPGAYAAWERKRAEKMAVEKRKERDHGDSGW